MSINELSGLNTVLTETCGIQIAPLHVAFGANAVSSSGALQIAGGAYRLCWCGTGAQCDVAENFHTDAGSLTMIGVAPLQQQKTCVSGLSCVMDGIFGHTSSSDQFLVLQTCGVSSTVPGLPGPAGFEIGPTGGMVSWGSITAAGGQYALCWCRDLSMLGDLRALETQEMASFCIEKSGWVLQIFP